MDDLFDGIEEIDDIFLEQENEQHEKVVALKMATDLENGVISKQSTKKQLKNWFCKVFFKYELDVSCEDLFDIAKKNNINIIG